MSSSTQLTKGAITRILGGDTNLQPIFQILEIKKILTGNNEERWRLVVTDGESWVQGMLSTQEIRLIKQNIVKKHSVIRLKEFAAQNVGGKKIIVMIRIELVQHFDRPLVDIRSLNTTNKAKPQVNRPAPPSNPQPFHQKRTNNSFNSRPMNNNSNSNNSQNKRTQPISSLNPYQNNWTIRARCTSRSQMRHYHTQRGEGKLFSVDLLDKTGGEIRAVMFNDAADKFFPIFESGQCYLMSKGSVKVAKKGFSHIKNEYQIIFNEDADVKLCADDGIKKQNYNFQSIGGMANAAAGSFIDVIGIVIEVQEISEIFSARKQETYKKRELKIADRTGKISLTIWGKDAESYDPAQLGDNPVIACKGCKLSDFGGRSLSASGEVDFTITGDEATQLLAWYQSGGSSTVEQMKDFTQKFSGAPRRIIAELKDMEQQGTLFQMDDQGNKKKSEYVSVVGTITSISHSTERLPWYKAVPEDAGEEKQFANAKVSEDGMGKFRCMKNNKVYEGYTPRYILRFSVSDFSGNLWMTAFNEHAVKVLGVSAKQCEQYIEAGELDKFEEVFTNATFKRYCFKLRAREDVWEDSVRVRYDVQNAIDLDLEQECQDLLGKIEELQKLMPECMNSNTMQENFNQTNF